MVKNKGLREDVPNQICSSSIQPPTSKICLSSWVPSNSNTIIATTKPPLLASGLFPALLTLREHHPIIPVPLAGIPWLLSLSSLTSQCCVFFLHKVWHSRPLCLCGPWPSSGLCYLLYPISYLTLLLSYLSKIDIKSGYFLKKLYLPTEILFSPRIL